MLVLVMDQAAEWHKSESTFHLESLLKFDTEMYLSFRGVDYQRNNKAWFGNVARRPSSPSNLLLSAGLLLTLYQVNSYGFG